MKYHTRVPFHLWFLGDISPLLVAICLNNNTSGQPLFGAACA